MVKWSILIPTVVVRDEVFSRLVDCLAPQIEKYGGKIEVVVFWNNFERQLGELREMLVNEANGEYVSFIDDDDLVPEYYCDEIYPLLDGVDYVGYQLAFYTNGVLQKPVIHSIQNPGWVDDGPQYLRRVTHFNPIKRELARMGGYGQSDYRRNIAEDAVYARNLDQLVKTEHYIPRIMHYYYQTDSHMWSKFNPASGDFRRPKLPRYFRFHPDSTKELL